MTAYNANKSLKSDMRFEYVVSVDLLKLVPRQKPKKDIKDELWSDLFRQTALTLIKQHRNAKGLKKNVETQSETKLLTHAEIVQSSHKKSTN